VSGKFWQDTRRKAPLYAGFVATGVAFTIPGAILPLLLRRWAMSDARGGLLLFSFYAMGTLGAYCARGKMHRSIARGALLAFAGALCLAWAGRWSAYAAIALYGCGLSLTMTSISLLLSQRFPAERRLELTRLNLVWAIGAALGPWLALHAKQGAALTQVLGIQHTQHVLLGVAAFFIVAAIWAIWMEDSPIAASASTHQQASVRSDNLRAKNHRAMGILDIPWPLVLLIFGATGVEAAATGWLTSYAQRAGDSLGITIGAAMFLWVGSLVSRIVHSTSWAARLPERGVLGTSMIAMTAALVLLVAWPAGIATMVAAAVLGLAAGPVYPLAVAAALRYRETSTAFTIAAVGAAVLPLATGAVSTWTHSLRAGLCVPLAVAAVMMAVVAISRSALANRDEAITEVLIR
jgi:MFS transporter, FHS family, glucose/mannose:H+ symporter